MNFFLRYIYIYLFIYIILVVFKKLLVLCCNIKILFLKGMKYTVFAIDNPNGKSSFLFPFYIIFREGN